MNKCFFVQVWGEQKHPKPDAMNKSLSTKEYFDKEKELHGNSAVAGTINKVILQNEFLSFLFV